MVAVVGMGTMGAGIAQVALEAGHEVRIHDVDREAVERGRRRIADGLGRRAAHQGLEGAAARDHVRNILERLTPAATLAEAVDCASLVVEAALEDLGIKRQLFRDLGEQAPPDAILATNTSALSVGAIGALTRDRRRVIGLHFFNPAPVMRLVEVVRPAGADPASIARAERLMVAWGKTPVVCADAPGFIVNRTNRPFTIEALRLLEEGGATIERIDAAVRDAGFPMGPFELIDLIGVDVNLAAARGLYRAFDDAPRFRPSPIQDRLVAAGALGRKSGLGFYRYDESGRRLGPSPGFETATGEPDAGDEIVDRIILGIVNEAYRALSDGIASADDIDTALRLGAGHPEGPFERVARLGGPAVVAARLDRLAERVGLRFEAASALRSAAGLGPIRVR